MTELDDLGMEPGAGEDTSAATPAVPTTDAGGWPEPNERHLARLKASPETADFFEAKFGPGSSARALGLGQSETAKAAGRSIDAALSQHQADQGVNAIRELWDGPLLGSLGKITDPAERQAAAEDELASARTVAPIAKSVADSVSSVAGEGRLPTVAGGILRLAKGLTGSYSKDQEKRVEHAEKMVRGEVKQPQATLLRSSVDKLAQSVVDFALAKPVEFAGIVGGYVGRDVLQQDINPAKNMVTEFGKRIEDKAKSLFPDDVARQKQFVTQVSQGIGSTAAFAGTGWLVRLMGAGEKGMLAGIAVSGAAGNVPDEFEKATKALENGTTTEWNRFINMLADIGLGATEALPFAPSLANRGSTGFRAAGRRAGEQMFEEAGQEFGQQLGTNAAAQALIDPSRDPYEGVLEGLAVGGITGGLFGAASSQKVGKAEARIDAEAKAREAKAKASTSTATDASPTAVTPDTRAMPPNLDGPAVPLKPGESGVQTRTAPQPGDEAIERVRTLLDTPAQVEKSVDLPNRQTEEAAPQAVPARPEPTEAEIADELPARAADIEDYYRAQSWDFDLDELDVRAVTRNLLRGDDVETALATYFDQRHAALARSRDGKTGIEDAAPAPGTAAPGSVEATGQAGRDAAAPADTTQPRAEPADSAKPGGRLPTVGRDGERSRGEAAPAGDGQPGGQAGDAAVTDADRRAFARELAGKVQRGAWGRSIGASPEKVQALIDEAVADGRLELRNGIPRRTPKAREVDRREAGVQRAVDQMRRDQSAYSAPTSRSPEALRGEPKNGNVPVNASRSGTPNAGRQPLRGTEGSVPEAGVSEAVRADEGGRNARATSGGGGARRRGDVGRNDRTDAQQPGNADGVPSQDAGVRGDTGDGARLDQSPDDLGSTEPIGLTSEQSAAIEAEIAADAARLEQKRRDRRARNYQITDEDQIGKGGAKAKVRANLDALRVLKLIEDEKRSATEDEKKTLVKYVGWGAFAQDVFASHKDEWAKERAALQNLMTPEEYRSAKASTINAHYTSPEVIKGMWQALSHLGFKGGRAIEPSAGIGHFIGLQPEAMRGDTEWTAVELDTLSGRITKAIYGAADVRIGGFEEQTWPDDHFDLAISNVPFDATGPNDPAYKTRFSLHDYFFVKALDKVRPGGLVAFITSSYSLDKKRDSARREMEKRGTFLGAIRLPGGSQGAFKANAGTDVTTDIVFFRKRIEGEPVEVNPTWQTLEEIKTPEGQTSINGYFAQHPEMMLGKMRLVGSMYSKGEPVLIGPSTDLDSKIVDAAQNMPADVMTPRGATAAQLLEEVDTDVDGIKEGAFYEKDGKLYRRVVGVGVAQKLNKQDAARVRAFMPMRDLVNAMLTKQARGDPAGMDDLRANLDSAYQVFVDQFGPINLTRVSETTRKKDGKVIVTRRYPNFSVLEDDSDAYKVASIELYDEKTETATKAAIFTEDIVAPYVRPEITGPADALAVSLNETGKVDIKLIAQQLRTTETGAIAALGDGIYLDPKGEQWQTATQYLSGDVRTKLENARAAAAIDGRYARNVASLEAVQPAPLSRAEVTVPFGASWVPVEVYNGFLEEVVGIRNMKVGINPATKQWRVVSPGYGSPAANAQWGTNDKRVSEIVEAALNSRPIEVKSKDRDDNETRDIKAEEEARAKATMLREAFTGQTFPGAQSALGGWVWNNEARAQRLEAIYNESFNRIVKETHDGSHLTFPGLARVVSFPDGSTGTINLTPARTSAVWRVIQNGNTLIDHVVGAGKTWTSIMAVMEMKRLGQIRRPMFVVPNHMLHQFSHDFLQAYPAAKLLIATKDSMSAAKRREFAAKAAAEKWDGIIITHSVFGRLRMDEAAYKAYYQDAIDKMEEAKNQAAKTEGNKSPTVKDIEKAKKRLQAKMEKLTNARSKDLGVTFEELGVDHLTVDEAHLFKNLWFPTRHTRVRGISNASESQRATDLYIKIRHLEKSRPGRAALFLTGTPLSNTMAEVYTMMRYLQHDTLDQYGIAEFDSWAQTFGVIDSKTELAPNGRDFRDTTSFSRFVNIPELSTLYGRVADTQTAESLQLPRPKLKGGKPIVVESDLSDSEEEFVQRLISEMEKLKGARPEKGKPNFISLFTKGLQVGTDMRLVDPSAAANPDGKLAKAANNIFKIWQDGNADPAAPDKAQLVFLDMGVPGSRSARKAASGPVSLTDSEEATSKIEAIRKQLANEAGQETEEGEAEAINEDDAEADALLFGKFNLYEDLKQRLIEKGMPAGEIAFIHDAKNDEQKAKIFDAVREGKIRVLLGSSAKMGVGTNVQKRLVAMHHIDAPWKPADVEQRDGRILRQGNKNKEVTIYRYVTKRSFDSYRWQILETKAHFIGQFRAGARGVRIAEDIDSPLPEAAELKAAATGNPLIVEHAEKSREARILEAQRAAHAGSAVRARASLESIRAQLAHTQKLIPAYEEDAARVTDLKGENFKVVLTVGGREQEMTDRKKAGEALRAYLLSLADRAWFVRASTIEIGNMSGFDLGGTVTKTPDGTEVHAAIDGTNTYQGREPFLINEETSPVALIQRWERLVGEAPALLSAARQSMANMEAQVPKLEAQAAGTPFPKQAELEKVNARVAELTKALKPKTPQDIAAEKEQSYVDQAMRNLMATSRTAKGIVDTSASAGKADKIAEGLTAEGAASAATANFERVIRDIYRNRGMLATMPPAALADAIDRIVLDINKGILKEGALFRTDDSPKYPYTKASELMAAREQFASGLAERLADPAADPVETAAWIEWRANLTDHFWADGVGKTSKALAAIPFMQAGQPLPEYRSTKEFFENANKEVYSPENGAESYLGDEWQRFLAYYRTLMPVEPGSAEDIKRRGDKARAVMESAEWLSAIDTSPDVDTSKAPGYGTPEWKEARRYETPDGTLIGYEKGLMHLATDAARKVPGKPKQERQLFVLLGMAGSGKSTIARTLQAERGAMHIVADDAKIILPEYDGGKNSGGVHEESSAMAGDLYARLLKSGYNLIVEKIGSSDSSIAKIVRAARAIDYDVTMVYLDVPVEIAMERAVARWRDTGRAVPMESYTMLDIPGVYARVSASEDVNETATISWNEDRGTWTNNGTGPRLAGLEFGIRTKEILPGVGGVGRDRGVTESVEGGRPSADQGRDGLAQGGDGQLAAAIRPDPQLPPDLPPPADQGAWLRFRNIDNAFARNIGRTLHETMLEPIAFERAMQELLGDPRISTSDVRQVAEAFTGSSLAGFSRRGMELAIRRENDARRKDIELARLSGLDPLLSGSNLDPTDTLRKDLTRLTTRLPEGVGVYVAPVLQATLRTGTRELEGGLFDQRAADEYLGIDIGSNKRLLAISTAHGPDVAMQTFTHEEVHVLREIGVLDANHWATLSAIERKKPRRDEAMRILDSRRDAGRLSMADHARLSKRAGQITYREIYRVDSRYREFLASHVPFEEQQKGPAAIEVWIKDKLIEETVAHAAADWADGRSYGTRIDRAMMAIRDFVEALGNFMRGNGYTNINQVFNSIWSGQLAKRFDAQQKEAEDRETAEQVATQEWMRENDITAMVVGGRGRAAGGAAMAAFASGSIRERAAAMFSFSSRMANLFGRGKATETEQAADIPEELKSITARAKRDGFDTSEVLYSGWFGKPDSQIGPDDISQKVPAVWFTEQRDEAGIYIEVGRLQDDAPKDGVPRIFAGYVRGKMLDVRPTDLQRLQAMVLLMRADEDFGKETDVYARALSILDTGEARVGEKSGRFDDDNPWDHADEVMSRPGLRDANKAEIDYNSDLFDDMLFLGKRLGYAGVRYRSVIDVSPVHHDQIAVFDMTNVLAKSVALTDEEVERGNVAGDAAPSAMFAFADRETGQSMRRSLDALGYYSKLDEVLESLGPKDKVTAATLQSRGVKAAEIEARWLKDALADGAAVPVSDLIETAGRNRVDVREVVRTKDQELSNRAITRANLERIEAAVSEAKQDSALQPLATSNPDDFVGALARIANGGRPLFGGRARYDAAVRHIEAIREARAVTRPTEALRDRRAQETKWSANSLDESNPTYRETTLGLPSKKSFVRKIDDFRQNHFPDDPNVFGHMQTSIVNVPGGGQAFLLDQIQFDWFDAMTERAREAVATKLFNRPFNKLSEAEKSAVSKEIGAIRQRGETMPGVKDEAKIAELKEKLDDATSAIDKLISDFADEKSIKTLQESRYEIVQLVAKGEPLGVKFNEMYRRQQLLGAELRNAESSIPEPHPLARTLDQSLNTTLRRAIRQAVESGVDQILIPSGKTVLSYNPGDLEGMQAYYDEIVPKNLRNLLTKIDKSTPAPQRIDTVDSPSGKTGLGSGFTVFEITDKVKSEVMERGQAMFAFGPEQRPLAGDDIGQAKTGVPVSVLAYRGQENDRPFGNPNGAGRVGMVFASSSSGVADKYALTRMAQDTGDPGSVADLRPRIYPVIMSFENPLAIGEDGKASSWMGISYRGKDYSIDDLAAVAREDGYDGLIVKNIRDSTKEVASTIVALKPGTARSATSGTAMFAFAGERSKTADLAALTQAKSMEAEGADRTDIWTTTGWFRGVDGKWRYEIDDSGATLPYSAQNKEYTGSIRYLLNHPDLMTAYHEVGVGKGRLTIADHIKESTGLAFKNGDVVVNASNAADARTTLLHEIQHQVQKQEDFANGSGGAPIRTTDSYARHRAHVGEQEAYAVEKRAGMTPDQRRARPPWLDYDVPEDLQIVRFANDKTVSQLSYSAEPPVDGHPTMRGTAMFAFRAFHGSPHDFDKFSMDKIGTGEGDQAYGHGLYFAESEDVAKYYRDALSTKPSIDGKPLLDQRYATASSTGHDYLDETVRKAFGDMKLARQDLEANVKSTGAAADTPFWHEAARKRRENSADALKHLDELEASGRIGQVSPGRMYEVRINADPEDFLDWDMPMSEQSASVKVAIAQSKFADRVAKFGDSPKSGRSGIDTHTIKGVAELRKAGVPGIRYLDQSSRSKAFRVDLATSSGPYRTNGPITFDSMDQAKRYADQKTAEGFTASIVDQSSRNYVVFDDSLIEIIAKDGKPVDRAERQSVIDGMTGGNEPSAMFAFAGDEPLDMSPEARKARAEAMGFDTSEVYYRGTLYADRDPILFRNTPDGKPSNKDFDGIFMSKSPREAEGYTGVINFGRDVSRPPNIMQRIGLVAARDPVFAKDIGDGHGAIFTLFVRRMKDFIWDFSDINLDESKERALAVLPDMDLSKSDVIPPIYRLRFQDALKNDGYGSIRYILDNVERERVVFDPTNIRSTNAAFDPAESDSPQLMASLRDGIESDIHAAQRAVNPDADEMALVQLVVEKSGPTDEKWSAKSEAGEVFGNYDKEKNVLQIEIAQLDDEDMVGRGYGMALYRKLIDEGLARGLRVFSDVEVSAQAAQIYEALKRRGYDVRMLPGTALEVGGSVFGGTTENGYDLPAFEIKSGPVASKASPPPIRREPGSMMASLRGGSDDPSLNKAITELKEALGLAQAGGSTNSWWGQFFNKRWSNTPSAPVTQGLRGVTIRQSSTDEDGRTTNRSVKLRPQKNVRGQFDRATGVMSVRQSRDLATIAHEGGHGLEMLLGTPLDEVKAAHWQELIPATDIEPPVLSRDGYSGVDLDTYEQGLLSRAVETMLEFRDAAASTGATVGQRLSAGAIGALIGGTLGAAAGTALGNQMGGMLTGAAVGTVGATVGMATGATGGIQSAERGMRDPAARAATVAAEAHAELARAVGGRMADRLIDDVLLQERPDIADYVRGRFSETGVPRPRTRVLPDAPALSEAFAHWMERYVMDTDGAQQSAPRFFEAFENLLDAEVPGVSTAFHEAQMTYRHHIAATPARQLASSMISNEQDNTWEKLAGDGSFDNISGKLSTAYNAVIDDLNPVAQVVRRILGIADRNGVRDADGRPISLPVHANPYKLLRLFRGSFQRGRMWLEAGIADLGTKEIIGPSMRQAMEVGFGSLNKDDWNEQASDDLGAYLVSIRAVAEYDKLAAKQNRLSLIDEQLKRAAAARVGRVDAASKATDTLGRREDALLRAETRLTDARREQRSAETEVRNLNDRLRAKADDILAAQMARNADLELRRKREMQTLQRDARRAVGRYEASQESVDDLEIETTMLEEEIEQRREVADAAQASVDTLDDAVTALRKERQRTEKQGASRPPTLESRAFHARVISELEAEHNGTNGKGNFKEAARLVHEWTHRLLTVRWQAGFLSDDLYEELSQRKDYYVPFQRDMSDASEGDVFFRGGAKTWSPFKKFDGSDRAIINPLKALSQEAYNTAQQIAFNESVNGLISMAERAGPGGGSIVERVPRSETAPANEETFNRIRETAINLGIDPADAHLIVQRMEQNYSDADVNLIWAPDNKGPNTPKRMPLWVNGERQLIQLNDTKFGEEMFNAFNGLGEEMSNVFLEWMAMPARWLRAGVTTHPNFILRNLLRDIPAAYIRTGATPFVAHGEGLKILRNNDDMVSGTDLTREEFLRLYNETGGMVGGQNVASLAQSKQRLDVMKLRKAGPMGSGVGRIFHSVEAIETAGRLGVAAHAYRRAMAHNPSLTVVEAMQEAAFVSRDVYDWGRRGSKMLALNRIVTFLNAAIQGTESAARGLQGAGDRGAEMATGKNAAILTGTMAVGVGVGSALAGPIGAPLGAMAASRIARHLDIVLRRESDLPISADEERDLADAYKTWFRMASVTLFFMLIYAAMRDDPWYEDIKDGTKATHSWLKLSTLGSVVSHRIDQGASMLGIKPQKDAAAEQVAKALGHLGTEWAPAWLRQYMEVPNEIRIPKPFEWSVPGNVAEMIWDQMEGRDPRAAERIWASMWEVLAPPGVPQAMEMIVGLKTGQDYRQGRDIVPDRLKKLTPHERFDAFSSQLAIDISKGIYELGGKLGAGPNMAPSPKMIDWVLSNQGAYWGKDIANAYGNIKQAAGFSNREASTIYDVWMVAGVTGRGYRNSKSIEEFWKLHSDEGGKFTGGFNTFKRYITEAGDPGKAVDFLARLEPEEQAYALYMRKAQVEKGLDTQSHPLERAAAVHRIGQDLRKEMILGQLMEKSRSGKRDFETRIVLSPNKQTEIHDILERLSQIEVRNSMILMERPGWKNGKYLDPQPVIDELRASEPRVYELYETKRERAKVRDWPEMVQSWPENRKQLLLARDKILKQPGILEDGIDADLQ